MCLNRCVNKGRAGAKEGFIISERAPPAGGGLTWRQLLSETVYIQVNTAYCRCGASSPSLITFCRENKRNFSEWEDKEIPTHIKGDINNF